MADDWQARALAAERELAELRTSPAYHDPGLQRRLLAAEADVARLREALESVRTAVWDKYYGHGLSIEYARSVHQQTKDALAATYRQAQVVLTNPPTPPDAVAALVRAAREVGDALAECDDRLRTVPRSHDQGTYAYQYGCLEARIGYLRALLDAPPWRDLR